MAITTFRFFIFAALLIILYFAVPKRGRWVVLLAASLVFYGLNGIGNSVFILITATSAYFAALWMDKESSRAKRWLKQYRDTLAPEERKAYRQKSVRKRKTVLILALVLNFGLLCFFKYTNFVISEINVILQNAQAPKISALSLLVPVGISFYTFTTMGYLIDVYWEKCQPQTNYLKLLLFTSFFPQILQGPISNYRQLGHQLYEGHDFDYTAFKWGVQRFFWGLLKKLAIANVAANYISALFENYRSYSGITVFLGILLYAVYIYADFSGYMDMMCGLCQILGIELAENFNRPYFSKSIAEYWRRWHITLGDWFKTYIYYAVGFSGFAQGIGKKGKKLFGNAFARNMPGTLALIVVWFTTGLWHGANWGYIIWGLLNGVFIIAQLWFAPVYARMRKLCRIREDAWLWKLFQTGRTFILVSFIKILPEAGGLAAGLDLWKSVFTNRLLPSGFRDLLLFVDTGEYPYGQEIFYFGIMCVLAIILFVFSLIQRKTQVRVYFNRIPLALRVLILAVVFVMAFEIGATSTGLNGAFLYEQF